MTKYVFLTIIFLLFTNVVFGCKMKPTLATNFDSDHYIFIGEVVEVVGPVKFDSQGEKRDAVGLKIKVSENVYLPKSATYYEVFPLRLTASCGLMSDTKEIRERYPIGSYVRVVAKESTALKDQSENSAIRLETSVYNQGSIARNDLNEDLQTSAKAVYDYKSFVERQRTTAEDSLYDSNYYLPEFELRKDLLRLKEAKSEDERIEILERLVFYPHINRFSFPIAVQAYIKKSGKSSVLEEKWKHRVQEFNSRRW